MPSAPTIDKATLTKAQDQIIETIELVQERVIDTNSKIASTLGERMPGQVKARFSALHRPELPQPADAIDTYFSFVERVTKANRKFATELVKVWSPAAENAPATGSAASATTASASAASATTASATTDSAAAKPAAAKKAPARKRAAAKATPTNVAK